MPLKRPIKKQFRFKMPAYNKGTVFRWYEQVYACRSTEESKAYFREIDDQAKAKANPEIRESELRFAEKEKELERLKKEVLIKAEQVAEENDIPTLQSVDNFVHRVMHLEERIEQRFKDLNAELKAEIAKRAQAEGELAGFKSARSEDTEEENVDLTKELNERNTEVEELKKKAAKHEETLESVTTMLAKMGSHILAKEEHFKAKCRELKSTNKNLHSELAVRDTRIVDLEAKAKGLNTELEEEKGRYLRLSNKNVKLQSEMTEQLKRLRETKDGELSELRRVKDKEYAALKRTSDNNLKARDNKQTIIERLKASIEKKQEESDELDKRIGELESDAARHGDLIIEKDLEVEEFRSEAARQCAELSAKLSTSTREVKRLQQQTDSRIHQVRPSLATSLHSHYKSFGRIQGAAKSSLKSSHASSTSGQSHDNLSRSRVFRALGTRIGGGKELPRTTEEPPLRRLMALSSSVQYDYDEDNTDTWDIESIESLEKGPSEQAYAAMFYGCNQTQGTGDHSSSQAAISDQSQVVYGREESSMGSGQATQRIISALAIPTAIMPPMAEHEKRSIEHSSDEMAYRSKKRLRPTDGPTVHSTRSLSAMVLHPVTISVTGPVQNGRHSSLRSNVEKTVEVEQVLEDEQCPPTEDVIAEENVEEENIEEENIEEENIEEENIEEENIEEENIEEENIEEENVEVAEEENEGESENDGGKALSTLPPQVQRLLTLPIKLLGRGGEFREEQYAATQLSRRLQTQLRKSIQAICEGKPDQKVARWLNTDGSICIGCHLIAKCKTVYLKSFVGKMACKKCKGKRPCVLLQGVKLGEELSLLFLPQYEGSATRGELEHWLPSQ